MNIRLPAKHQPMISIDTQSGLDAANTAGSSSIRQRREAMELVSAAGEGRRIDVRAWIRALDKVAKSIVERIEVIVAAGQSNFGGPGEQAKVQTLRQPDKNEAE
ncbi:MAG TPA: hypothetical protein VHY82_08015 [Acetobacteraceae bacterium]|nr:hypothetical protein [Acetobacteraceae bacterium]